MDDALDKKRRTFLKVVATAGPTLVASSAQPAAASQAWQIRLLCDEVVAPWRASMIGIRSMSEAPGLLESLPHLSPIGPSIFSLGVWFDGPIGGTPRSPAVVENADGSYQDQPSTWLNQFESRVQARGAVPLIQTAGAPPQVSPRRAVRPAIHPMPTDLNGYDLWSRRWFADTRHVPSAMFVVHNEPGHSLADFLRTKDAFGQVIIPGESLSDYFVRRRMARQVSADASAEMLRGVQEASRPFARVGVGAFIAADHIAINGQGMPDGVRTYFDGVIDSVDAMPGELKPPSFVAYNNFYGRYETDIFGRWDSRIGVDKPLPALLTQYTPRREQESLDGQDAGLPMVSRLAAACDMLTDMDCLTRYPCEVVCKSFWVGGPYGLLRPNAEGVHERMPAWHALNFLASIPPRRFTIEGLTPTRSDRQSLGVHDIAGHTPGWMRALLWNDSTVPADLALSLRGMPAELVGLQPEVLHLPGGDTPPTGVDWNGGSLHLPAETVLLVTWRAPSATDPTQRRRPLGSACLTVLSPLWYAPRNGSWGKWDGVRGLFQLFSRQAASMATARLQGTPLVLFLTAFVDGNVPAGQVTVWAETGVGARLLAFQETLPAAKGHVRSIDLARLLGSEWASGARTLTVQVEVRAEPVDLTANVWLSASAADAQRVRVG